jgi:hypothetical protein
MKELNRKLWPFSTKSSLLVAITTLVVLLLGSAILRSTIDIPFDISTNTVLIGIVFLSLLPVVLAILDVIIDRGGSIGYGDFKLDFSKVQQLGAVGFAIPANIGERGVPVSDSATTSILQTMQVAVTCGIVVIDLEDGHAWWETRLLVLLAGAERLRKPDKIVFVAKEGGKEQIFQGWANPDELLQCLIQSDIQYKRSLTISRAAARQWELVEPLEPILPNKQGATPLQPSWMSGEIAKTHQWMAYNYQTGLPNEMLAEQILQDELGKKIEQSPKGAKHISIERLNELFRPCLIKKSIDQSANVEQQRTAFFDNTQLWIALTNNGQYSAIISRMAILNEILKPLVDKSQTK